MLLTQSFHNPAVIRDQQKAVTSASVGKVCKQRHGSELVECNMHDLGTMDARYDLVDRVL